MCDKTNFLICLYYSRVGRPKFREISLPQFFGYSSMRQGQWYPVLAIWVSLSVLAKAPKLAENCGREIYLNLERPSGEYHYLESSYFVGFFLTKIFHPNVSSRGEICVNTLKKDWKSDLGLKHILLTIKCLLIVPNPESALNEEAGKLLLERYDDYCARYGRC